jgi:trans-feruloyl-CoA hydratase/vanillin synthase
MTHSAQPSPATSAVLEHKHECIVTLVMNRPDRLNALNNDLSTSLNAALGRIAEDEGVRVVVITGGGRAFCAGGDLGAIGKGRAAGATQELEPILRSGMQAVMRIRTMPQPVIAAVNGPAAGAGMNIALACDIRIASEDATFGLSEINWGIIPAGTVTKAVASVIGQRATMYYIMTGETFDGRKAAAMGLVNEAVPRAELRARTAKLAATLLEKNPMTLRIAKHAARRVRDMSWEDAEDYLFAKSDQLRFLDPEHGREKGMAQFLDEKSYRPGLAPYRRDRS